MAERKVAKIIYKHFESFLGTTAILKRHGKLKLMEKIP